ncbi:MAG: S1 family peptidase [Steroidobacteraceae bacterium]|nr:S1 family peptidase [Steroidobacteraceae bacterium]
MRYSTLSLVALGMLAGPMAAHAVTHGDMDGDGHPYVGIMVAKINGQPVWRCSGTLISPTLFLTAGHCTDGATSVEVWFDPDMATDAAAKGYPFTGEASGTPYTHPDYNPNAFSLYDLGVVVLDQEVVMGTYGALPALNQLDILKVQRGQQNTTFTAVGYGLQESFPDAASWKENNVRIRMVATPRLQQINGGIVGFGSLLLSNNANTGGTCFGDSGGPNFIGNTNVIAGVTSFGLNGTCAGTGGVYRVDRQDDLDWLATFMD